MKKGILFDLDGTLWDSAQAVVDSWNEVIEDLPDFDKKITLEDMHGLMGKTMDDIAFTYFHTVSRERALEIMRQCTGYENEYIRKHGGILFEHVRETFAGLAPDYFLAIVSNCQKGYIEAFLDYYGLWEYISDTECFENTGLGKGENIRLVVERNKLEQAVYVGDIHGDYESTMQAGLPFIFARYGFGEVPEAEHIIDSLDELKGVVSDIL